MKKYLEAGKIVNTHGVAGLVRIQSWCDSPELLASLKRLYLRDGEGMAQIEIASASVHKNMVLARISGVDTFDRALALKENVVFCLRSDIPVREGEHFIADLIGLDVIDASTGRIYGKLKDVIQNDRNDIYEIDVGGGREAYMPAVREFIDRIELEKGIYVKPIEGIFDEI